MTSLYISVEEAHKLTTLSRATLYRAFADGTIKTAKVRGRWMQLAGVEVERGHCLPPSDHLGADDHVAASSHLFL